MSRLYHGLLSRAVVLALCLAGCESGHRLPESGATLEGTVTHDGKKVTAALVIAEGNGPASTAFVDDDGYYKLENVPLGEVRIGVDTRAGEGRRRGAAIAQSQSKKGPLPPAEKVDPKYFSPTQSGITTTTQRGANKFDIAIPK
jgi:hypothetical protein